jgi:hypothetical protein
MMSDIEKRLAEIEARLAAARLGRGRQNLPRNPGWRLWPRGSVLLYGISSYEGRDVAGEYAQDWLMVTLPQFAGKISRGLFAIQARVQEADAYRRAYND